MLGVSLPLNAGMVILRHSVGGEGRRDGSAQSIEERIIDHSISGEGAEEQRAKTGPANQGSSCAG